MFKKIICIAISFIIITSIVQITPLASSMSKEAPKENKIICNATIDDNFVSDELIVVFNSETSLKLNDFSTTDFKEISAVSVKNLTKYTSDAIKQQRERKSVLSKTSSESSSNSISEDSYHQFFLIKLNRKSKDNVLKSIKLLEQRDDVISVSPNYIYTLDSSDYGEATFDEATPDLINPDATTTTNDTYVNQQWALKQIHLFSAWDLLTNHSTVKVGILDTGINHQHPDLQGKVDISLSKDFSDENTPLYESAGHGTAIAGIIGAEINNNAYIAGVCNNVSLVSLKVTYRDAAGDHYGNSGYLCSAIDYASANNIPILSYSISSPNKDPLVKTKLQNYSGLFICSAGNTGTDIGITENNRFPACFDTDNTICVANSNENDAIYSGEDLPSCYSTKYVDLAAPGTLIYTTTGTSYAIYTGTSVATPYVTGVAALLKSEYSTMDTKALKDYILTGVDVIPELEDKVNTSGRLNAYKALASVSRYTVIFNPTDGGGTMANQRVVYGCVTPISKNTFTREGYTFAGWHAHRENDDTWYYTNGTTSNWYTEGNQPSGYYKYTYRDQQKMARTGIKGGIITLYAQWKPRELTISFNSNNGVGNMPILTIEGAGSLNLPKNTFTRTGCTFDHWYAKKLVNNVYYMYYINGTDGGWYAMNAIPDGYNRADIINGRGIAFNTFKDTAAEDSIVLCAYWKPTSGNLGDVDGDSAINTSDVTTIQKHISGQLTTPLTDNQCLLADVNFDGNVTTKDVTLIQKYLSRIIDEFGE